MTFARRPLGLCAAGVALAVSLTGCGLFESDGSGARPQVKSVEVPSTVPVTFKSDARWDLDLVPGSAPAELSEGLAVVQPGSTDSTYRVALVSAYDGDMKWVSKTLSNPTPDTLPKVSTASVKGESWVLVETQTGKNEVALDAYSAAGTGDRREPASSGTFTGLDSKTLPEVNVDAEGVVVHYSAHPDLAEWREETKKREAEYEKAKKDARKKSSKSKKKSKAPSKPKMPKKPEGSGSLTFDPESGKSSVYDGPGTIRSVWAEGTVVTNPSSSSGFGFVVDAKVAWESKEVRPAQASSKSIGSMVASGPGIVIGQWQGKDGDPVLAVHEIRTGKVIATLDGLNSQVVAESEGRDVETSGDGEWAAWGPFVFGLKDRESTMVNLNGGEVSAIHRDVLYVEGAKSRLTASSAAVTPSSEAASVASDAPKKHEGMVDIATGDPLTNTAVKAVPLFVSSASQGVFVLSEGGKTRLYSAPLS